MKILLLGDYSNCHRTLATGLLRLGHDVTVISNGSFWMNCHRDIDISRKPGKTGGLRLFLRSLGPLHRHLKGYDVVALHDPQFLQLKPARLRYLFDRLKRDNGSIFLTAMSTDIGFLDMLEAEDSPLKYSEWFVYGKPARWNLANPGKWEEWHEPALVDYQRHVFDNLDGAVSILYEYVLGMDRALGKERSGYGGIPIDLSLYNPVTLPDNPETVKLFLGRDRTRMPMKGSDFLEIAARRVTDRYPGKAELTIVENRPFDEFVMLLCNSHVVLDQIYSYTPATTALMAMAYGLNTVSGGESDFYDYIGEHTLRPVINAPVELDELTETLDRTVSAPELIAQRGRESRLFVEKHNDCEIVAARFLDFWTKRLNAR